MASRQTMPYSTSVLRVYRSIAKRNTAKEKLKQAKLFDGGFT